MVFTAEVLSAQGGGHAVVVPKDVAATFSSKRPPVLADYPENVGITAPGS